MLPNTAMTKLLNSVADEYDVDYADFFRRSVSGSNAKCVRNTICYVLSQERDFNIANIAEYFGLDRSNLRKQILHIKNSLDKPKAQGAKYDSIVVVVRHYLDEQSDIFGETNVETR